MSTSLLSSLPKPILSYTTKTPGKHLVKSKTNAPYPPYGQRSNFQPQTIQDFGDGGAFPEIKRNQYPLGLGLRENGSNSASSQDIVPVTVDQHGNLKHDSVLFQAKNSLYTKPSEGPQKTLFTSPEHSQPMDLKNVDSNKLKKPSEKDTQKTVEATRSALENALQGRIRSNNPRTPFVEKEAKKKNEVAYIKVTPSKFINSNDRNPFVSKQKIVRLQTLKADPLEPPKHRFRKQPKRAPSPPAPVMRSPPRKLTREEAAAWKIPPCVSNWKNIKGFTIPLDKRVAADGRAYQSHEINDRFSSLSTALYEAENSARENVRLRGEQLKKIAQQKRVRKEKQLEEEARSVIQNNSGIQNKSPKHSEGLEKENKGENKVLSKKEPKMETEREPNIKNERIVEDYNEALKGSEKTNGKTENEPFINEERLLENKGGTKKDGNSKGKYFRRSAVKEERPRYSSYSKRKEREKHNAKETTNEREEELENKRQREELRRERMRERRREFRMEERKKKKGYAQREKERGIEERIALGQTVNAGAETLYDSRLFNTEGGINSGNVDESEYGVYDGPLFPEKDKRVYVPRKERREDPSH